MEEPGLFQRFIHVASIPVHLSSVASVQPSNLHFNFQFILPRPPPPCPPPAQQQPVVPVVAPSLKKTSPLKRGHRGSVEFEKLVQNVHESIREESRYARLIIF